MPSSTTFFELDIANFTRDNNSSERVGYARSTTDGTYNDDTEAFEAAIDLIRQHGGGRLVVSASRGIPTVYRLRPINLTSNLILYLQPGVILSAVPDE